MLFTSRLEVDLMATVKIHVWHRVTGEIVSIGRPVLSQGHAFGVVPRAGENDAVLEAEVDEELITDLHRTHVVDIQEKKLKPARTP